MATLRFVAVLFVAAMSSVALGSTGVPAQYAGNWTCQTFRPGYNLQLPSADPSQPLTNKSTTPATVTILKFSLNTDGTYETAAAKGHYTFDGKMKSITWLDGPHEKTVTKTELGNRDNGAPKIGLTMNQRYYGCFLSKP
jgi:hypothetical protein